ncbi:MAG: alpha/beta hydrolase [Verrucomicrobia bacterium]|nr:alpha/beta hydrolase [Verrucomicrobiota bacterium]MBS0636543.1 alpha/beta hydrolase [Verrucomicrobiota bacterium]
MKSLAALLFIAFSLQLAGQDCCPDGCSKLNKHSCKIKKKCITVPARDTEDGFVPEAEIYVKMQGKFDGKKPVVLFVHGNGFSSDSFDCQQDELCSCYPTIAVDLRGFGRSSKTTPKPSEDPNSIDYSYTIWADDIKSVLSQLKINHVVWVGSSNGGNIGIIYSLRYPGEICKLVLQDADPLVTVLDPSCTDQTCQILPSCDWQFPAETGCQLQFFGEIISQIGYEAFLQQFLAPAFFNELCQTQVANAQAYTVEGFLTETLPILLNISTGAQAEDLRPLLPQLTVPTMICYGSIDAVVPPGASLYMHENIPNSVLVEFVGKGHQVQVTAYKQFNKILKQFIESWNMPDVVKVFDEGCCVCPKVKPVHFKQCDR